MRARHKRDPKTPSGIYYSVDDRGVKTWEVRYTDSTGKRRWSLGHKSLTDAKAAQAALVGKSIGGEKVASASTTINDLLPEWRALRDVSVRPRTRDSEEINLRTHIIPRWGRTKVRDITKNNLTTWANALTKQNGEPMNSGTKALILTQLSTLLDYAVDEGVIAGNPVRAMSRKAKPRQATDIPYRILDPGELDALLAACERFPWLRDIIRVDLHGALRLGEACGLTWGQVDFDAGLIMIDRQIHKSGRYGPPKGGRDEAIPMLPEMRRLLAELNLAAKDTSDDAPVFTNTFGEARRPHDVQRAFGKARRYGGLSTEPRPFRFHDLRHTAISLLANAPGAVLPQVQRFARHSNLTTTMRYIHPVEREEWTEEAGAAMAGLGGR